MKSKFVISLITTFSLFSIQAIAAGTLDSYNLIVKEDFTTKIEVGGKLHVGGDFYLEQSAQFGFSLPADPNVDSVTVVGNVTLDANIQVENGHNMVYGGTLIQNNGAIVNMNGGGSYGQGNQSDIKDEAEALYAEVVAESAYYKNLGDLSENGSYTYTEGKLIKLTGSSDPLTVINLDGALLDNSNGEISFSSAPTTPVVINVSGTNTLNLRAKAAGNLAGDTLAPLVLWNFYEATEINLLGDGWVGSILAPGAHINAGTNGHIEGAVAAVSYEGQIELHNSLFTYVPPTDDTPPKDVPAPPSLILLGMGLLWIYRKQQLGCKQS